jgi:MFS transporter, ACS family, tartrate transporter
MKTTHAVLKPVNPGLAVVPPLTEEARQAAIGRSALRKASVRLLPLIGLGYGIAYMDRVNVSFAALQMNKQLHFSATVFGLGAGLFFLSYAACEVPSNLMLMRFGARRWLARIMVTWGLLSMGMILVRTPVQFCVMRLLLGTAEAGFFPGVIFYLMQWFPAGDRAKAVSRFYIAWPLSSTVMGALAGWLMHQDGRMHLAGWQWLLLAEGLPAVLMSAVFLLGLPDSPAKARWLTEDERAWILRKLMEESEGRGPGKHGLAEAFGDPRVWLLGGFFFCVLLASYGYAFSAPALVEQVTGLGVGRVGFIIAGLGVAGALAMLGNGWDSDRTGERFWHIVTPLLLMAAGYVVVGSSVSPLIVLPGLVLVVAGNAAVHGPVWTIPCGVSAGQVGGGWSGDDQHDWDSGRFCRPLLDGLVEGRDRYAAARAAHHRRAGAAGGGVDGVAVAQVASRAGGVASGYMTLAE